MVRFAAMASMKNTVVLGFFILAGFAMHAYLHRYEGMLDQRDGIAFEHKRFNKITAQFEMYVTTGRWSKITSGNPTN